MKKQWYAVLAASSLFLAAGAMADDDHPINDALITTKVKAELAKDSSTSASNISVTTKDGVVILSGHAGSKSEAEKAEKDAKLVKGVKDVRNKIEVK